MTAPTKENSQLADKNGSPMIGTRQSHIADAIVNYATPGLDTEAEVIVAFNATNTTINAILAVLEAHGLTASS